MNLIHKSLKCGVFDNLNTLDSKLGVPQGSIGSIVSPILANIYFNELDEWISSKAKEVYVEKSTKRNPEYKRIQYQIQKLNKLVRFRIFRC